MTGILGSAAYELVFNTTQATVGMEETEAVVNQATARIGEQLSLVDASFGKVGTAAGMSAKEVSVASAEMGASASKGAAESAAAADKTALSWSKASASIKKAGSIGGSTGALIGLGAAYFMVKGGIEWLKSSNAGWLQVKNAIQATGGVAGVTAQHASDLADQWEKLTGAARGDTLQVESLLLRFQNIRNVGPGLESVFDRTLTAIENVAAATGRSITSVTTQIGKAIQDPTKYLGMLARAGVTFSATQTSMVKKLAETKGTLAAQLYVLQQLDDRYKGAAVAAGKTFAGQLKIAEAQVDSNSAAIVTALIPSFETLVKVVKDATSVMAQHKGILKDVLLGFTALKAALFLTRTAIITVETAMKVANVMTMTLGKSTAATATSTKALGGAEEVTAVKTKALGASEETTITWTDELGNTMVATSGKTEAMGATAATTAGEIDTATASTKSFRLASIAAGTTLGGLLAPLALAAGAYATISYFANQANDAVTNLKKSSAAEGSDRSAELSYYDETYKNNIKKGMSPSKAKAAAIAATNKHASQVGLPSFSPTLGATSKYAAAPAKVLAATLPKGKALIPVSLQITAAKAGLTSTKTDDVKAEQAELSWLQTQLTKRKLTNTQELTVLQEMADLKSQIDTNLTSITAAASAKAAKARAAAKKIATAEAKKQAAAWKLILAPTNLTVQLLKAERTPELSDDIKVLTNLETYYTNLIKSHQYHGAKLVALEKKLTTVVQKIAADKKKVNTTYLAGLKEIQAAEDLRGTFFGDFSSSVFHQSGNGLAVGAQTVQNHKAVKVEQNNTFHEIPKDRYLLSRQMKTAAEAAMG